MSYRGGRGGRGRGAGGSQTPPLSTSFVQQKASLKPEPPSPVAVPPPAPQVSQIAPVTDAPDIPMPDAEVKKEEKPSWMRKRTKEEEKDNRVARRKRKNAAIVKSANPRTSIQALSEIAVQLGVPLPVYENFTEAGVPREGFYVDCVFQGVRHTGFGTSHSKAKQAACELHIRDIIRANMDKLAHGKKNDEDADMSDAENPAKKPRIEEDPTPWTCIYAFVMKKYLEMMEMGDAFLLVGPKGAQPPGNQGFPVPPRMPYQAPAVPEDNGDGFVDYSKFGFGTAYPGMFVRPPAAGPGVSAGKVVLPGAAPPENKTRPLNLGGQKNQPSKNLPENAPSMNAIMVLNQMRPDAVYSTHSDCGTPGENRFKMSVKVDGETYEGFGPRAKEAKKAAAKRAVLAIYGIECVGV